MGLHQSVVCKGTDLWIGVVEAVLPEQAQPLWIQLLVVSMTGACIGPAQVQLADMPVPSALHSTKTPYTSSWADVHVVDARTQGWVIRITQHVRIS